MALQVSLIIGTRDRPDLLAEALESVRKQTALERIGQIIVSEGGSTIASRETCARFPDLPITYFDHRPPMTLVERIDRFWEPINNPIVALLHDDDWWTPDHVEKALPVLEARPDCAAIYARWYESYGPHDPPVGSEVAWLVWVATGCDFSREVLILDPVDVLLANLLNGSCHYSTLLGRSEAIRDAYRNLIEMNNMFDNDRVFPIHLSSFGKIAYLTKPNASIRLHPGMDSMRPGHGLKMFSLINKTTLWFRETKREQIELAVRKFNETIARLPMDQLSRFRQAIFDRVHEPHWSTLVNELGLKLPERPITEAAAMAKLSFMEAYCPPALLAVKRRLARKFRPTPVT